MRNLLLASILLLTSGCDVVELYRMLNPPPTPPGPESLYPKPDGMTAEHYHHIMLDCKQRAFVGHGSRFTWKYGYESRGGDPVYSPTLQMQCYEEYGLVARATP